MQFTDDTTAILALTQDGRLSAWNWKTGLEETTRTSNIERPTSNSEVADPFDIERSTLDVGRSFSGFRTVSPDGTRFATLAPDLRVRVWRTNDLTPISPPIHHNPVTGPVQFSASGRYLFTMHPAYAVFVWDLDDRGEPPVLLRPGAPRRLVETGREGSVTVTRDPNSPIRVRGLSGPNEVSLHPSSLKENPVQAWFDATGQFIVLETPGQRAQVWDAATGLPVTPNFQSRYATSEVEYRTVRLPTFPKSQIANSKSEILSGSRLDGTGGWKPLELGEIVPRWNEWGGRTPTSASRPNE
jgi:WD40 repeat protein